MSQIRDCGSFQKCRAILVNVVQPCEKIGRKGNGGLDSHKIIILPREVLLRYHPQSNYSSLNKTHRMKIAALARNEIIISGGRTGMTGKRSRIVIGILAASANCGVVFAVIYAAGWALAPHRPNWNGPSDVLHDLFSVWAIYAVSGLIASCLLGLPTWLLYLRLGLTSRFAFALGGFALGGITVALLDVNQNLFLVMGTTPAMLNPFTLECGIAGSAAALAFRRVVLRDSLPPRISVVGEASSSHT